MYYDNTTGNVGIGTAAPATANKLEVAGQIKATSLIADNNLILSLFTTPLLKEFSWTGTQGFEVTLPTGIDTTMKAILADVFLTASSGDHQNVVLGVDGTAQKNWVETRGQQPSTQFGSNARQSVILTYPGEVDGFSSNYGLWYCSQVIPLKTNARINFQNYGNSGSNGWVYMVIRGYFK